MTEGSDLLRLSVFVDCERILVEVRDHAVVRIDDGGVKHNLFYVLTNVVNALFGSRHTWANCDLCGIRTGLTARLAGRLSSRCRSRELFRFRVRRRREVLNRLELLILILRRILRRLRRNQSCANQTKE